LVIGSKSERSSIHMFQGRVGGSPTLPERKFVAAKTVSMESALKARLRPAVRDSGVAKRAV
jgi:hypothetical protein